MKVPSRHHIAHDLCESIYRKGAKNSESAINFLRGNLSLAQQAKETLSRLVSDGVLQKNNNSYSLTDEMRRYIHASTACSERVEIVKPAEPTESNSLSSKYFLNMAPRRPDAEPLRDMSFKNGSVSMSPFRQNDK